MKTRLALSALALAVLAAPLVAEAQQPGKVYRIGVLSPRPSPGWLDPFSTEMRRYGWIEGRDYVLEHRYTEDEQQRAPALAAELASRPVDVILTINTANTLAARQASATIPIVMLASGYPVEAGLAVSLARPGGNVTGNSIYAGAELFGKYVSLLHAVAPGMRRLGVLWDYAPPAFSIPESAVAIAEMRRAAGTLGVTLRLHMVPTREALESALAVAGRDSIDALFVTVGPVQAAMPPPLAEFIVARHLPTMTDFGSSAVRKGSVLLMAYSPSFASLLVRGAYFVDRILRGAKPADLPIEQPTKFELVINLKTAKALGLTIPASVLARADEVIQ